MRQFLWYHHYLSKSRISYISNGFYYFLLNYNNLRNTIVFILNHDIIILINEFIQFFQFSKFIHSSKFIRIIQIIYFGMLVIIFNF